MIGICRNCGQPSNAHDDELCEAYSVGAPKRNDRKANPVLPMDATRDDEAPPLQTLAEVLEYAIYRVHEPSVRYGTMDEKVLRWLSANLPDLIARESENAKLRERLKLVDRVCHSHHAASLVTWDGSCPVCEEAGGVEFYIANAALYRGAAHLSGERTDQQPAAVRPVPGARE